MEKIQIEKLWNISNNLDEYLESIVYSKEDRVKDILTIKKIQKDLEKVISSIEWNKIIYS
jgi:hypothetical protein